MKKRIMSLIFIIIIMLSFCNITLAQPTTTFNHNNTAEEDTERTNNRLKTLNVENYELYPEFNSNTINYYLSVNTDVHSLNVTAEAEVESATVRITGNESLYNTENQIKIAVTPKSRITKTYTINVIRRDNTEALLSGLEIENGKLSPDFSGTCFFYTTTVEKFDLNPMNIKATPASESSSVEIIGNDSLNEGKNLITILVRNGENVTTYQIEVDIQMQTLVETITNETGYKVEQFIKNATNQVKEFFAEKNKRIAFCVAGGIILFLMIIVIIRKRAKKKKAKVNKENLKRRAK